MSRRGIVCAPSSLFLVLATSLSACSGAVTPAAQPAPRVTSSRPGVAKPTEVTSSTRTLTQRRDSAPPSKTRAQRPTVTYVFPVADCSASYASQHHDYPAADIFASRGCGVVAPVAGTVDEVGRRDTWSPRTNGGADRGGRYVSVVGDDGVRYYMSHLEDVGASIQHGRRVRAGQQVGTVGDSGSARGTGTHLHFGISWPTSRNVWWIRRGMVSPARFLRAWQRDKALSPADAVLRRRSTAGLEPSCHVYC